MLISLSLLPGSPIRFAIAQVGPGFSYSDLDIDKTSTVSGAVGVGARYDYEITAVNLGPDDDTGVIVEDTLPDEVEYVSDTCSAATTYDDVTHTWTWQVGDLAAGNTVQCSIRVEVRQGASGEVVNIVSVHGNSTDDTQDNNEAQTTGLQALAVGVPVTDYRGLIAFVTALVLVAFTLLRRSSSP